MGGECESCGKKTLSLQRKSQDSGLSTQHSDAVPLIVHDVLRSPGQPLDSATRASFEPRFGHDFSHVRVHTDAKAAESANAVNALAYTVGRDVVFGRGQYSSGTSQGRALLAHELTHVLQQGNAGLPGHLRLDSSTGDRHESAAQKAEALADTNSSMSIDAGNAAPSSGLIQRRIIRGNVSCERSGLTNPNLTGDEVIAALEAADAEAITLALRAELLLDAHLLFARAGEPVDPEFDTILQEELGLTLTNPAHFRLIEQQRNRFRRVRETLESGYLRYICRGGTVSLVGCTTGTCGSNFAFSCPGNRLVVLCQAFWDDPAEQAGTILHEPFHIWFHMARHASSALRRADATCFEAFARRLAGEDVSHISCVGHTAG
ncbi:MAG: DUF4157 domain-containing protein [Nitrospira sp.]